MSIWFDTDGRVQVAKIAIIALLSLVVAGCGNKGEQEKQSSNPNFNVTRLFTHEGCAVYRFSDVGAYRYYAVCGGHASTDWTEGCGKGCTRNVSIDTAIREVR